MNAPAVAGQHQIVDTTPRLSKSIAIAAAFGFALLVAVAHLSHLGPRIDHPSQLARIGEYLCKGNNGLRAIHWRLPPNHYDFKCRDGAVHPGVQVNITDPAAEPQS